MGKPKKFEEHLTTCALRNNYYYALLYALFAICNTITITQTQTRTQTICSPCSTNIALENWTTGMWHHVIALHWQFPLFVYESALVGRPS